MSHQNRSPSADHAWRFSLLSLLVLIAGAGWGAAALVNASELWVSMTFSATAGLLAVAVLVAVFRRGRARTFAIGFAVCGWLYLLLCHWPDHSNNVFSTVGRAESKLITRTVTNYVYHNWLPKVKSPPDTTGGGGFGGGGLGGGGLGGGGVGGIVGGGGFGIGGEMAPSGGATSAGAPGTAAFYPIQEHFLQVAHSLWALVAAVAGGIIARRLASTRIRSSLARSLPID